ncbi:MAG: hypothetical protein BKP49_10625 [Treponema sp. CETP13]|nr:MAG: hypothetical protein BKP49_10625 [Treponema sp. CETP13]
MKFDDTKFSYFFTECINRLGNEEGIRLFKMASDKLEELFYEVDDRNSKAIREHMTNNMLPTIAIYQACIKKGMNKIQAYNFTLEIAQVASVKERDKNKKLGNNPLGYFMFKLFCKKIMAKNFPKEGWNIEWVQYDKTEIHFNMKTCIYAEITKECGCPELCSIFCANDVTTFSGFKPNIFFERTGTIGEGQKVCDFHFKNHAYIHKVCL